MPSTPTAPPWTATNSAGYEAPAALAADVVVLTARRRRLHVLLVTRADGAPGLPGGMVGQGEAPADTAQRKLVEKTGLRAPVLEQLATFAAPGRDPRGWIPTVAHLALVPAQTEPTDLAAGWQAVDDVPSLAFDHDEILKLAVARIRGKLWWSSIALGILSHEFTLSQAREVYEAIATTEYDPATFARDLRATGLIEPTGEQRHDTGGRPARLYRFTASEVTWGAGRRKRIGPAG